ncbi:glutamate receptor ionotropic, kainate 2-like isoform X1 [Diorhabda sublineata]|uniref:glutamate receptor ionotropic, kainate 2-like isoform X1 n=1 Tax=Diorhabda sublineata TaxID=1163346 RepID=UPI0024E0EA46|nr:glutamate receptor ionotropic, kainate 2-like isoform X1 [Diorhabda sublineata]
MIFLIKTFLLVNVLVLHISDIHAENYKIGAIFEDEDTNQREAIQVAVDEINQNEKINLELIVEYISRDNPYQASKATCSLLAQGVVGILGPLSEDNSNTVQSICDLKEIPHLEVRWDDYPANGTLINLHPYPDTLTRTYYDLIAAWGWQNFVILYENNESLQRVGEIIKLFNPRKNRIVLRQLNIQSGGDYRRVLKEVWRSGATHFLLDCSIEILEEVLKQAQQVGLMTNKHHFIITNLDLHTIELMPYQYSETNITGMRFVDPDEEELGEKAAKIYEKSQPTFPGYKLRLQEALTFDAIKMFAKALEASEPLVEANPISCYNDDEKLRSGTTIVNEMKNLEYTGLTGPIKFDIKGFRTSFALDVFELMEGGQTVVGHWNTSKSPSLNISRLRHNEEYDGNSDIRNKTFKVMITLTEPYGMRVESMDPVYGNDQYEGFAIDIIKELSAIRGFNYTFVVREDKKNGEFDNKTGQWNGIIGDLIDENADLAICDLTITKDRAEVVDFTGPYMMLGISILYKKPTKAPPSFFSFADPFAFEVWKLLIVSWVGVSLVLFALGRISPTEWENPYPCIEEPEYLVNQLDLRNCVWFITGSIMQQGSEIELKSISTRMVAGMWWFFTLLMVSSYTANLAAFLTTEKPDPHFSNLHELVENSRLMNIMVGAKAGGATANFFKSKYAADPDSDFGKIYKFMLEDQKKLKIIDNKDGVQAARKGYYAFFMEDKSIEYEVQRKCDLYQVGDKLDEKGYGIAMRKNSTYRNSLSTALLLMQNSGKIDEIKRKWWEERKGGGQCSADAENGDATPLNLKGVGGVFWVTIGGTILSFFLAMFETTLYCIKKSKRFRYSFWDALKEEIKFYFKFGKMEKEVGLPEEASGEMSDEGPMGYGLVNKENSAETLQSNNSSKSKRSKKSRSQNRKNNLRPPRLSVEPQIGWRHSEQKA